MCLYSDREKDTHGDGHGHIAALLFERTDDSADGVVKKFGNFLPGRNVRILRVHRHQAEVFLTPKVSTFRP